MRVEYKRVALQDITDTREYIKTNLKSSQAAHKLVGTIVRSISLLADNPLMGMQLREKLDVDTDIRFLVVAKQIVFYELSEDTVSVLRVIDGRRDYMSILFD